MHASEILAFASCLMAFTCAVAAPVERKAEAMPEVGAALGRGINMGNMLEAPSEGAWGARLQETYFKTIAEAGFTNVRIPCRWNAHAAAEAPYAIDPAWFERVDRALRAALEQKLTVVLNIHHYEELTASPAAHRARFLALWKQIAEHYAGFPPSLWLELLNEPHDKLDAAAWNELLRPALAAVRASNPDRIVVVGGAQWSSIGGLAALDLPEDDRRLVATFHYYDPFHFTHQGAGWAGDRANEWLGTQWTGSADEQRAIRDAFDKAVAWGCEHHRPLYLGEFGAYSKADLPSRVRWTRFIADEARRRGIGFSYWEFCSGFGCYDPAKDEWRVELRDALLDK